jgi:hypothetical protein
MFLDANRLQEDPRETNQILMALDLVPPGTCTVKSFAFFWARDLT